VWISLSFLTSICPLTSICLSIYSVSSIENPTPIPGLPFFGSSILVGLRLDFYLSVYLFSARLHLNSLVIHELSKIIIDLITRLTK
jgi:hypothetical protein